MGLLKITDIFIPKKPSTAATTVDSDNAQTYQWLVPLNECGVVASVDNTDAANVFTKYDLYLNANRIVSKIISLVVLKLSFENLKILLSFC